MKARKILAVIIILIICLSLASCAPIEPYPEEPEESIPVPESFVVIDYNSIGHNIYQCIMYDPETLVMYSFFYGSDAGCSVTVMYNADGTLRLYTPHIEATE